MRRIGAFLSTSTHEGIPIAPEPLYALRAMRVSAATGEGHMNRKNSDRIGSRARMPWVSPAVRKARANDAKTGVDFGPEPLILLS